WLAPGRRSTPTSRRSKRPLKNSRRGSKRSPYDVPTKEPEMRRAMRSQEVARVAVAYLMGVLIAAVIGAVTLRAAADRSETLVYAVYNGQDRATQVFKTMRSAQGETGERIESYAIVSKDLKGNVRVRDQRKRDAGVGAVLGGVIGLLGGPLGVAAGATAGGAFGYLTGDAV